jgi:basic membrane protein A and related proteins
VTFVSFVFMISACMQPPDCFREDVFCAALVTDTLGIEDHGANQEAWAGLQAAKSSGLADQVAYIESVDTRDYDKNIRYFTDKGYDVIVTTGAGMHDETLRAADRYPASVFVGINQTHRDSRSNLTSITYPEDQMGFLAGALAARLTKTGVVAGVCETSGIDAMFRYCEGFRAGVRHADENIRVLIAYRDSGHREQLFVDEAWGYENGGRLIFRGADVVFAAGGITAQGALRAALEAGVYAIGTERNQALALADSSKGVVTSLIGQTGFEVQETMRLIKNEEIPQVRIGQFGYVPLSPNFPESLKSELDSVLFGLWVGEIKTNVTLMKP